MTCVPTIFKSRKSIDSSRDRTCNLKLTKTSGKRKFSLQEALDLLPNLPSEISDVLTEDFSDEEVQDLAAQDGPQPSPEDFSMPAFEAAVSL
ncbi:hypothetical protein TNCV_3336211 [Trichonephila clavipes]|nr:hypothetical protein TNCV_3336211 [Trichonephila clavipes]